MNARDAIAEHLTKVLHLSERRDITDMVLDAATAGGFVVVACPPGGRVVVSRESKPCETCKGEGSMWAVDEFCGVVEQCSACGGSGVVEATTTYRLEQRPGDYWIAEIDELEPLYRLVEADPQ